MTAAGLRSCALCICWSEIARHGQGLKQALRATARFALPEAALS